MKTAEGSLEDRYIWQVERRLPESMRADVADELRGTIADMVEARGGSDDAVRAALAELGDPRTLADGYAPNRRYLIGPAVYGPYLHILKLVLAISLPVVLAIELVIGLWNPGADVIEVIIEAVGQAIGVGIQIFFWMTIGFAILDRMDILPGRTGLKDECSDWSVDDLPQLPVRRQITAVDSGIGIALLVFSVVGLSWQHFRSVFVNADGAVPLLDPALWNGWIPGLILLIVVAIGIELWKYRVGRWTMPVVVGNALLDLAVLTYVLVLATTRVLVNQSFADAFEAQTGTPFSQEVFAAVIILGTLTLCIWDIVDSLIKHRHVDRYERS